MGNNCCGHNEENTKGCGCGCGEHEHEHEHDHECGCGCAEHEYEAMFVELEDEEGNAIQCEIVDGFVFKDDEYALVQNPNDGSIYLFKVVGDDEVGELVVPSDDEYDEARAYYEELAKSEEQ